MPHPTDQELWALLLAERRRNAQSLRTVAHTTPVLPDLLPEMLLSPSALREIEAVQGMRSAASYLPPREAQTVESPVFEPQEEPNIWASLAPRPEPRQTQAAFDLEEGLAWTINLDEPEPTPSGDIESLFMASALRETGETSYQPTASSFYDDFTFNSYEDMPIEGTTEPNPAARFQVGRESPPRMAFSRDRVSSNDGAVVSSRTADGSWRSSTPSTRAAAYRPAPMARPVATVASRPIASTPRPPAAEPYVPSALERLISGRGVLDD